MVLGPDLEASVAQWRSLQLKPLRDGDVLDAHDVRSLEALWSLGEVELNGLALV